MPKFDFEGARKAGYSDEEIKEYLESKRPKLQDIPENSSFYDKIMGNFSNFYKSLSDPYRAGIDLPPTKEQEIQNSNPNFDVKSALESGYNINEINNYLESKNNKKERSFKEKAARLGAQYGLGLLQGTPGGMAYDISTLPLKYEKAQNAAYRETLSEDIERLIEQKAMGQLDEQDQKLYDNIVEQIKDPRKSMENVQTADLSIRGLAEKASGVDLEPEGIWEKAANWTGMIKDPSKLSNLFKNGLNKKDLIKAISPNGTETLRGLAAGTALKMAEEGDFGPIGTMAAAVVGDLAGHGISNVGKKIGKLVTKPKETLAKDAAKVFTPKEKIDLQKEIIQDFRKQGIQADLGTTTGNDLIKWMEARISQSGLAGKELREFKDQMIDQVKDQYRELADALGESRFATQYEAGETLKNVMKSVREKDLSEARNFYKEAEKSIKKDSYVNTNKLVNQINEIESNLKPGALKSSDQKSVLETIEKLKRDITDSEGNAIYGSVKDLINNKIALNDIINYEVQGGTKQLLKKLVSELDRSIISYGKQNPSFAKNYINANRKFSEHAKSFRNKNIDSILIAQDPERALSKMNTVHGIKDIEKALSKTSEGKKLFDDLKRYKLDDIIGKKLIDNTTSQAKLGSFSKLLDKGKNKELIREILGSKNLKKLELLQKNAGKLSKSAEQYYNASKSGVTAIDAAVILNSMKAITNLMYGNPWPLMKVSGGILTSKKLGKLLADPEFLKLAEDAILAYDKNNTSKIIQSFEKMKPLILRTLSINEED